MLVLYDLFCRKRCEGSPLPSAITPFLGQRTSAVNPQSPVDGNDSSLRLDCETFQELLPGILKLRRGLFALDTGCKAG